jgi:hypothetical protein
MLWKTVGWMRVRSPPTMHTARRPGEYDRARSTLRVVLLVGCPCSVCMGWDRQVEASIGSAASSTSYDCTHVERRRERRVNGSREV